VTCGKCGKEHPGCTGHISSGERKGQPCRKPCKPGQVCTAHGGRAPQVKAAQERRAVEVKAAEAVRVLGLPVDVSPTDALLQEVQWTAGHVAWLRGKVQELEPESLVWGATKKVDRAGAGVETTDGSAPSVWYELYARERDHLVKVSAAALRAGVEERKVRLAESQGNIVIELIRRVLDGLYRALITAGFDDAVLQDAWDAAVADVVPREVRALATQ